MEKGNEEKEKEEETLQHILICGMVVDSKYKVRKVYGW